MSLHCVKADLRNWERLAHREVESSEEKLKQYALNRSGNLALASPLQDVGPQCLCYSLHVAVKTEMFLKWKL